MLRPLLGSLREHLRERLREWRIRRLVRQLQAAEPSVASMMPVIERLRRAWGNESYTADVGYLAEMVQRVLAAPGPVLDCGSGISTVILATLARRSGHVVWSLEQDDAWYRDMRHRLAALDLPEVRLLHAPLEVVDDVAWYAVGEGELPSAFPVVVCDGPAIRRSAWPESVFLAWRSGVVDALRRRHIAFDTIVLDDAHDKRCPLLLERWRAAGLDVAIVDTPSGSHVVAQRVDGIRRDAARR